jgi:hypothetical protein
MAWQRINLSIRKALEGVSLADHKQLREPQPPPDLQAGLRTAAASRRSTRTF